MLSGGVEAAETGYAWFMGASEYEGRLEHNQSDEEGEVSETSALEEPVPAGDADATDKSTGTAPDKPEAP